MTGAPIPIPLAAASSLASVRLPRVASRGFFLCGADPAAIAKAAPIGAEDLQQNARCLWESAQALGLLEELRAERADQVRRQGGLLT